MTNDCRCLTPPFDHRDFTSQPIGIDKTAGRFAEVTIETCRACGRRWLHYLVEVEGISRSGRWYRGLISDEVAQTVRPEAALGVLGSLAWRFAGGSYFASDGFTMPGATDGVNHLVL
jgi:hypothetical protein